MEARYKIGDISSLLGIPAQTLRFYEEKGIIKPYRDEHDGYRYFDAWDVNYLMDTLYLRSLEFPLAEVEQLLNEDSLPDVCGKFMRQENEILKKIAHYRRMLGVLTAHRQSLQSIESRKGRLVSCKSREMVFHRHRRNYSFQSLESGTFQGLKKEVKDWVDSIMEAPPTFLIPADGIQGVPEDTPYWWGWSMDPELALEKHMDAVLPNEYLPSVESIYTVFEAGGRGTFMDCFYEQVLKPIRRTGRQLSGNPYGRLIAKVHEENGFHRYFEVWVPTE